MLRCEPSSAGKEREGDNNNNNNKVRNYDNNIIVICLLPSRANLHANSKNNQSGLKKNQKSKIKTIRITIRRALVLGVQ